MKTVSVFPTKEIDSLQIVGLGSRADVSETIFMHFLGNMYSSNHC